MSYEYEEEPKRRLTFGNIILSLLLLGTVIVIGLIVLVYFKLTGPEKHANMNPAAVKTPVQPVEKMSPTGKPISQSPIYVNTNNAPINNSINNRTQEADDAVKSIKDGVINDTMPLNNRALTNGANINGQTRKPPRRRRESATSDTNRVRPNNTMPSQTEEIPLQPINRERTLTPRNQSERELTSKRITSNKTESENRSPTRTAPQAERPLTPIRPQNNRQSESINQLF